jgi:hypothetical protein
MGRSSNPEAAMHAIAPSLRTVSPAAPFIEELPPARRQELLRVTLSLSPEDRWARFSTRASDAWIRDWFARTDWAGRRVFVARAPNPIAAAELVTDGSPDAREAEAALAIDYRVAGPALATALLSFTLAAARAAGIRRVRMECDGDRHLAVAACALAIAVDPDDGTAVMTFPP